MTHRSLVALGALLATSVCRAGGPYTVTTTANSGAGSLRWAITQANLPGGEYSSIKFASALKGRIIKPTSALPSITQRYVSILGDIDQDNAPDIQLDGSLLARDGSTPGLEVWNAPHCTIGGLSVVRFPGSGIRAFNSDALYLFSCHLGVDLTGTVKLINDFADLYLLGCTNASILGGMGPVQRNILSGGVVASGVLAYGLLMQDCSGCDVIGNYFGLTRDGRKAFGGGCYGVGLAKNATGCTSNLITDNVFAGVRDGIRVAGGATELNEIKGNWFGLKADGQTVVPGMDFGVYVYGSAHDNLIGNPGWGNVFGGCQAGVGIGGKGTSQNTIQANWFGLDAGGIQVRGLRYGVLVGDAGPQTIGGATASAGNLFAPSDPLPPTIAIKFLQGGSGSIVRYNRFGLLPSGGTADPTTTHILNDGANVDVVDNTFVGPSIALDLTGLGASSRVLRNRFRNCVYAAVRLQNQAHASLGDLDSQFVGEGRNVFALSNLWNIRNETPNRLLAEGNTFGATTKPAIDAKIWDKLDDATLGRVDYIPLQGGIIPTGGTEGAASLALSGATALPTATGAEIVFSVSAPARVTVEVLNLAGRPVALLARDRAADAGSQRLLWTGRTTTGSLAPSGPYFIRILAHDNTGRKTTALAPLYLRR
ncbi:MAG: hypothetical protein FJX75_17255 [Armatimonadetes bacterium]|nr:hypothetical protein [Armatimonadota bacterium]